MAQIKFARKAFVNVLRDLSKTVTESVKVRTYVSTSAKLLKLRCSKSKNLAMFEV